MSLIIYHVRPERVLVATDTLTRAEEGGPLFESSKMQHIPHMNAIVAGRGSSAYIHGCANAARTQPDFDALIDSLAAVMGAIHRGIHQEARRQFGRVPESLQAHQEILFAGWSARAEQFKVIGVMVAPSGATETADLMGQAAAGGWDDDDGPMPDPSTAETALQIAVTITRTGREKMPGYPLGGRLCVAELTRDACAFRIMSIEVAPS